MLYYGFCKSKKIIKITPAIYYHAEFKFLEIGWLMWSFCIGTKDPNESKKEIDS